MIAILAQGALGYAQYFSGVPPLLVLFHVLGAVLVFTATVTLYLGLFTRAGSSVPDADTDLAADR